MSDIPKIRLYVEARLAADAGAPLDAEQVHYLKNVMRREIGDSVLLFNGEDGEWMAEIAALERRGGRLHVRAQTRPHMDESAGPWLLFAPVKRQQNDLIAQKATELGAAVIWPVITQHTNADRLRADRMHTIAREAAEQCGRLGLPEIREPSPLGAALEAWPEERTLLVMDETGGGTQIAEVAGQISANGASPIAILIGPEGGFAKVELDALANLAFVRRAGLGQRILRAETAAIAALACIQAIAGDWRR
ncbi:MAG: 16S rRNA (uracil(1498)-N(3))-methyltransferase [Rhodospirillaceae bacterium]|jgi:16S rRNA (uracil1498-N3)-methyltransferase|nr:16S rRNA (uracil(1498)-N(3))-methyltransferase [Rhodospirillaceae bacterium]MBT3883866.1 16S rRNA (uracil(1498)-N(3))-methyltransferase [Rhodospirillaceae bacterium]MBT4117838.1 16S rRNA (uracil(1498)-N(3))-methyltransferase [Rhodospirillaceae bacterium]MBT4672966.1 16S rRNA (uracil(1498)-N(3))-methyltransferase [Rhodospirillaceae bacterium]MBT4720536.1 16S rRNA (uracil(1498)-N(3))-methyltransferase [Rhodospirillaceae bacterium]